MTTIQSGRRDPRYPVRPKSGSVEFEQLGHGLIRGSLKQISVSGISFVLDSRDFDPPPETRLPGVRITIGDCRLFGDLVVRHANMLDPSGVEIGGLFHPASDRDAETLMVLISAIDSTRID